jgi:hydroxymethylpyrimidine pyrophosphatase-like HAD family hydrolase
MKLVLLDLDDTLIDTDYCLTVPENEFRAVIQELNDKGVCVGLCSDSAVITLRQWVDRLGLTGPIVAERGAVVWDSARQIENILDIPRTVWFREFRESFINAVMRNFPDATIMIGDATRLVKDRRVNTALTQQVFAVNGFRVASFSFFACRLKSDQLTLEPDSELLKCASALAAEIVVTYGKKKEDLFWNENSQCGILTVHARITEKWRGISVLINQLKPDQTVMVGDGMSDFLDLPHVAQYAVGNADPRYKLKAAFVAERSLTEGVIECLRRCV